MAAKRRIVDGKHQCYKCDTWKPLTEFYPDRKAVVGLRGRCKLCDIAEINAHHTNHRDRALKNLVIKNRTNGRHGSKRRQAFSENSCVTPDVLNKLWFEQDGKCAVTLVPLTHIQGAGRNVWTNVTVDRIDPERGYEIDNIRLVCRAVNYMKAAMSDHEMLYWAFLILNGPLSRTTPKSFTDSDLR